MTTTSILPLRSGYRKLTGMSRAMRERGVTIIEFGSSYDSLDDRGLEEAGSLLLEEATHTEPPLLVLDLSKTEFIGSTFIELLIRAWKRIKERGGKMALCAVQPFCVEVLAISRLDTLWNIHPSRAEAVNDLAVR